MARLTRNDDSADQREPGPPETAEAHLAGYLFAWMRKAQVSRLPAPLPAMATDAATWWLSSMCPKPPMMIDGDAKENARLHSAHVACCRSALRGFLSLTTKQRFGVVSMCTDGHLALSYRGESFRQFVEIAGEADLYADNPEKYRRDLIPRTLAALRKVARSAA